MAKLKGLFDVIKGTSTDLVDFIVADEHNGTPYVSRSANNNSISAYVLNDEKFKKNPKNTISIPLGGDGVLTAHYHEYEYYSGQNVAILKPKNELMTKNEILYYCICLKKNAVKYCYGRHANRTLMDIDVPDYADIPTWVNNSELGLVEVSDDSKNQSHNTIIEDVYLFKIFNYKRGKAKPLIDLLDDDGFCPVISSTSANNGITGYTKEAPTFNTLPCLTLAINGSIGSCFFQELPFHASADVAILTAKDFILTKNIGLYVATLLKKEGELKYSYGRKIDLDSLANTLLKLPTKDGVIQWGVIEKYMENINKKVSQMFYSSPI